MNYTDAHELAQERVLADLDTMADWICGECIGKNDIRDERIKKSLLDNDKSAEDLPTYQLFALMFDENPKIRASASWVMRERYLAESHESVNGFTVDYVNYYSGMGKDLSYRSEND